jgi:O-antigen/teichoic acid export membrane protein
VNLRSSAVYNLLGSLAPAAAALVAIPLLLKEIGDARFGVLALAWLVLGHFAVFDFGLSRATANRIARLAPDDRRGARQVLWTSLWMNLACGTLGAILLFLLAQPFLIHLVKLSGPVLEEALAAAGWIAVAVPLATLVGVLTGALDGREQFPVANVIQGAGSVAVQLAPVIAAYFVSKDLDVLIGAAVLARAATAAGLLYANIWLVAPYPPSRGEWREARALFGYGAWVSISALIMPFFVTLDKFVVGSVLGTAAVAYYSVPDQIVRRVSAFPAAIVRSLFPRLSALENTGSRELSMKSARIIAGVVTPAVVTLIIAIGPFMTLWIDDAFAARARAPAVLLAAGIWLNSLAMIPSVYLQASGRPDATAKSHLIEIVPHIAILWASVAAFGAVGAATAMLIVTALDACLLMAYARMPLWRAAYFWQGATWIAVASLAGLWFDAANPWRYGADAALVGGAIFWALRLAPELVGFAVGMLNRLQPLFRRGH